MLPHNFPPPDTGYICLRNWLDGASGAQALGGLGLCVQCKCSLEETFGWDVEVVRGPNEGRQRWYGMHP